VDPHICFFFHDSQPFLNLNKVHGVIVDYLKDTFSGGLGTVWTIKVVFVAVNSGVL